MTNVTGFSRYVFCWKKPADDQYNHWFIVMKNVAKTN
jgi:hypothetical protein